MRQHARRRRALLPRVAEGRRRDRGHRLVQVGVGIDDHAVLPAHLGHDALHVQLLGRRLRRGADDREPDRARAGEGDRVDARVAHQRLARVAEPGQERDSARGNARLAQRARERVAACGRLLGRLQDDRVAGRERGGRHPAWDRDREVPRRDHRRDAARGVAHRVALAAHLEQLRRALELHRLARVVLEEVDRLADVGIRLAPTASRTRAPRARPGRAGDVRSRSAARTSASARSAAGLSRHAGAAVVAASTAAAASAAPARPAVATMRPGFPGSVDSKPSNAPSSSPIRIGTSSGRRSSRRAERLGQRVAVALAPDLELRLVHERLHGAARSSSTATPRACSCRNDSFAVFSSSRRTR